MTVPKWLIPALAVVAALAVGIAAVLIGVRFAPTTVDEAQPNIISVPVLSPIDDPSVEPGAELDGGGTSVSGPVGEASVVAPGGGDPYALSPEDEDYLAALGASDDPGSTFPPLSEPAPDGTPAGDPCALPGAAASDCPAGVTAVVLELPLPEFQVRAGSASESSCEGSFATSPTQIRFDIRTNAPASMNIDVSQAGEATRTVHLETSEAERLRWQADFTANTAIGSWIFTAACGTFTDLVPDVPFALHIVATDDLGRVATFDRSFTTVSGRTRPPTEIYPVGNSLIW
ncbi:MAG: hypothetical protein Q8M65_09330, partial [Rhodoglobus sp.]|nr:hypothetical protein [Rhodoglobus sp.]